MKNFKIELNGDNVNLQLSTFALKEIIELLKTVEHDECNDVELIEEFVNESEVVIKKYLKV